VVVVGEVEVGIGEVTGIGEIGTLETVIITIGDQGKVRRIILPNGDKPLKHTLNK
jgi:hypothetical protein